MEILLRFGQLPIFCKNVITLLAFTAVYICFYLFTLSKISCKVHSARSLDVLSKPQPVHWFQPFSWRPSWPFAAFLFQSSSDTLLPPSQKTIKTICNHCNLRSWKIFCVKTQKKSDTLTKSLVFLVHKSTYQIQLEIPTCLIRRSSALSTDACSVALLLTAFSKPALSASMRCQRSLTSL